MISHRNKCIFVHIIKTGGISVATALSMEAKQCHYFAKDIRILVGDDLWKEYFTFTFVRNPWDKIVSQYFYNGKKFSMSLCGRELSFEDYVKEFIANDRRYTTFEPQNLPNIIDNNREILVDFVGRFENLNKDFKYICKELGVKNIELPTLNSSKHKHYSEYYNNETKNIVADKFKDDIEYFNYTF